MKDISFQIQPGERVAFVGANGSGKSTSVKLMCRLYDPTEGSITIGGRDLRELDKGSIGKYVSVFFQDYAKYQLTARENIWLGDIDSDKKSSKIEEIARAAGVDEFVSRLKSGYDTQLGRWFESGEELSEGQWQKIALARAFMKDSGIIILDEPTNSMDAKSEFDFFTNFRQLVGGRTSLLISHRLSTVKMVDRIFVFDQGALVEMGSHCELMVINGIYAQYYNLQSKQY